MRVTWIQPEDLIGHELGHLRLGHEIPIGNAKEVIERMCKPLEKSRKAPERAASVFASEIVMPEPLVKPYCAVPYTTLAPARAIACDFITSVFASAMRDNVVSRLDTESSLRRSIVNGDHCEASQRR